MGIGSSVIAKLRQGQSGYTQEKRTPLPKHPGCGKALRQQKNDKWPRVLCFLCLPYHSAAEVLPTRFKMPNGFLAEGLEPGDDEEKDEDYLTRYVSSFLQGLDSYHRTPDLDQAGPGTFGGPRRYLQHRKPIDVYYEYVAFETAANQTPAGLATFLRIFFHSIYKDHLKFRGKGEHAECNVCSSRKKAITKARNSEERAKAYRIYSSHLLSQWVDRQCYWHQRTLSQSWFRPLASNMV